MEPPHSYVREASSSVVHHEDYLSGRSDHALCAVAFETPARLDPSIHPVSVCPDCEAKLPQYHLKWWRETAEAAIAELEALRRQVAGLPAPVPESRREIDTEPRSGSTDEQGETTPTPLLDEARKELLELLRQFEDTVPYWRVKNSIDAFSDKLNSDERVLLAHEIGADGSFIRWCTREIEDLGWQITNSPVHGDADDMMEAWTQDLYPPPKKTKWRLGRSRSFDGS